MGSHPLNLTIRFLLELAALIAFGFWGWQQGGAIERWLAYFLALGLPIAAAAIWGVFNVVNDPSRSGKAPIVVPGFIRLIIELAFFTLAIWAQHSLGYPTVSLVFGSVVVIHYLVSYDRIMWLIRQ